MIQYFYTSKMKNLRYSEKVVIFCAHHFETLLQQKFQKMVTLSLLTKEDLQDFKKELLQDITSLFENKSPGQKKWLRTSEVKKLLNVSAGTLQNYRINGTLSYKKLGGSLYYSLDEIQKLMQSK